MKYLYAYKTSDGTRHEASMDAESREAVFAALREKGIKAIKVVAADGSKANGEVQVRGVRKRVVTLIVILTVLLVGAVSYRMFSRPNSENQFVESLDSTVRRQLIGDAAVIEKGIRTGWADIFAAEGDRFLASFAIPGISPAVRATTEEALRKALDLPAPRTPHLALEARQIIAIVAGMKAEARQFVADGGTLKEYGSRLVERQEEELRYYNMVKGELETAVKSNMSDVELESLWEKRNNSLRQMGIKLVSLPD